MGDVPKLDGGAFFAADIASIAASGSSSLSNALLVKNDRTITIQGYFTGVAGATANVEFQLFGKVKTCTKFDTKPFWVLPIAANGASEVVQSDIVDVADYEQIKLKIVNKDGTNAVAAVNAFWGAKRLERGYYPR